MTFKPDTFMEFTWPAGYTSIVANKALPDSPGYLAYNQKTGATETGYLDLKGSTYPAGYKKVATLAWETGWSALIPFSSSEGRFLLRYKKADGTVRVDRFASNGYDLKNTLTARWITGLTSIELVRHGDDNNILAYDSATGRVGLKRINATGTALTDVWSEPWTYWSTGWTTLLPVYTNGETCLLGYKSAEGRVSVDRFNGTKFINLYNETSTDPDAIGWSVFSPLPCPDLPGRYLAYRKTDARVKVEEIDTTENGTDIRPVWWNQWSAGWTTFLPFEQMVPRGGTYDYSYCYLAYKITSGEVDLDEYFTYLGEI